jgi:hypothetical protein
VIGWGAAVFLMGTLLDRDSVSEDSVCDFVGALVKGVFRISSQYQCGCRGFLIVGCAAKIRRVDDKAAVMTYSAQ